MTATFEPATEAPADAVTITVSNQGIRFDPEEISVPSGPVVFYLVHEGGDDVSTLHHNFNVGVDSSGPALVTSPTLNPGDAFIFTVTGLEAGEYQYWCTVDSHYTHGMIGTLTVTAA